MDDKVADMIRDLRRWKTESGRPTRTTTARAKPAPRQPLTEPETTAAAERAAAAAEAARRALETAKTTVTETKAPTALPQPRPRPTPPDVTGAVDKAREPLTARDLAKAGTDTITKRVEEAAEDKAMVAKQEAATAIADRQADAIRATKTIVPDIRKPAPSVAQPTSPPQETTTSEPEPAETKRDEPVDDAQGPVARTAHPHDQHRYHFDSQGRDRQLLDSDGQPVAPEQVSTLYKQAFAVYGGGDGFDVCSNEYARETRMPEAKQPVPADLSDWERVQVPPGQIAIDPRLGRLQFSGGKAGKVQAVGRCHIPWGEARDVFVSGNYAYLATGESTYPVTIYDIADPATPVKVGMIKAGHREWPTRVFADGNRVYIPSRFESLGVVDVSNVSEPRRLARLTVSDDQETQVRSLAVSGEYAYLTVRGRGVSIWHVPQRSPAIGIEVKFIEIGSSFNCFAKPCVTADHLFLVDTETLLVYDVRNPEEPERVASASIPPSANLEVRGNHAFLAGKDGAFTVMDISDLSDPRVVGRCRPYQVEQNGLDDIALDGNFAYATVLCRKEERVCFVAIDISKPDDPQVAGEGVVDPAFDKALLYDDPRQHNAFKQAARVHIDGTIQVNPTGIAASDGHVYVSDLGFGLWVFDVSDSKSPRLVGGSKDAGEVSSVYIHGDRAYVAQNMLGGLSVLDIASPSSPRQLSSYYTGTHFWACPSFHNEYVYGTGYADSGASHLHVLDVMSPTAPRLVQRRRVSQERTGCVSTKEGRSLLFMDGQIMSLDDPSDPKVLSQIPAVGDGWALRQAALGDRLYLCRDTEFAVVDVSDPLSPRKLGSVSLPTAGDWKMDVDCIRLVEGNVLVPHGDEGLLLIDISDESAPRVAAQCPVSAFKASHRSLLSRVVSKLAGDLPWSTGAIMSADLVGDTLYVADYRGTIYQLDYPNLKSPKVVADRNEFGRGLEVEGAYLYRPTLDGLTVFGIPRPSEAPQGTVKTMATLR